MQWVWGPFAWNSSDAGFVWEPPPGCFSALDFRRLSDQGPQALGQRNFALFAAEDSATFGVDHRVIGSGDPRDISLNLLARQRVQTDLVLPTTPQAGNLAQLMLELFMLYGDPDGADMAMPLVPTLARDWTVAMAGYRLRIRFAQSHAAYDRLRALLRRTYKRLYEAVQVGELPANHHRKWLGFQMRKYFGRFDDSRYTELHDGTVPNEPPLAPTTVVSDNFDRADNAVVGADWTEFGAAQWSILSNQLHAIGATSGKPHFVRFNTDLSSDDHYSQITNVTSDSSERGGLATRFSDAAETCYFGNYSSSFAKIYKVVSATATELSSAAGTFTPPFLSRLETNGSSHALLRDGLEDTSVTDTSITANLRAGVGFNGSTGTTAELDDFEAGDLAVPAAPQPLIATQAVHRASHF